MKIWIAQNPNRTVLGLEVFANGIRSVFGRHQARKGVCAMPPDALHAERGNETMAYAANVEPLKC